jgi:hypothetical protein
MRLHISFNQKMVLMKSSVDIPYSSVCQSAVAFTRTLDAGQNASMLNPAQVKYVELADN